MTRLIFILVVLSSCCPPPRQPQPWNETAADRALRIENETYIPDDFR